MGSSPFSLSAADWKKIGTGALIAVGGALLTWGADSLLPDLKERGIIDAAMFVFFSTLINALRKWFTDTTVTVLLILGLCGSASATELIDIGEPGDGKHRYEVVVKDGKIASVLPLAVVRVGQSPDSPPPVAPPSTPFVLEVQKQTQAALDSGATKTTGAALSAVYSLVADGVADGSIDPAKAFDAVKTASDMILSSQTDGAKWATFRADLGKALTVLRDGGKLNTKADVAGVFREIAAGMNLATGFKGNPRALANIDPRTAGILDGLDLAKIIELIKLVMELLKLFKGVG